VEYTTAISIKCWTCHLEALTNRCATFGTLIPLPLPENPSPLDPTVSVARPGLDQVVVAPFPDIQKHVSSIIRIAPVLFVIGLLPVASAGSMDLFDNFSTDWRKSWKVQQLFAKPTQYDVVDIAGVMALHAVSRSSNAGLVRELSIDNPSAGTRLMWDWRIHAPLENNQLERKRSGDDYAARVCIIFEDSLIPLRTHAINYVWAAHEPVDSVFASPYSSRVGMFVLRSGENLKGQWVHEDRDVFADYRKYFGTDPSRITAVGIVVDTDNTDSEAEAWFSQLTCSTPSMALEP